MPTMKIEVDITKPPKEEATRIEMLITELQQERVSEKKKNDSEGNPYLKFSGILKGAFGDVDPVELQRKWRSDWD